MIYVLNYLLAYIGVLTHIRIFILINNTLRALFYLWLTLSKSPMSAYVWRTYFGGSVYDRSAAVIDNCPAV